MADELADFYVHTAQVRTLTGGGGYGDTYAGTPVTVPCFLDDTRKQVRSTTGDEVVSETTLYCALEHYDTFTPGSQVALSYRSAEVIGVNRRDAPGLPLPEHLEVTLS